MTHDFHPANFGNYFVNSIDTAAVHPACIGSFRTLADLLHPEHADVVSVIVPGTRPDEHGPVLSYRQLHAQVMSIAQRLSAAGVSAGDVVSLSLPNGLDFVCTFLAVTWIRAAAAPLNPAYTIDEVMFYLGDTQSKLLLLPRGQNEAARQGAGSLGCPVWDVWPDGEGEVGSQGAFRGFHLQPAQPAHASIVRAPVHGADKFAQPDDVALILHTSGTTSRPKAVPLTHRNLVTSVKNIARTYELQRRHRSLLVMPLFHVHGLVGCLLASLHAGASVVVPPKFSAGSFWSDFLRYRCTWFTAVPTIHQILLQHERTSPSGAKGVPRGRLEFIRSCSSALAPATFKELEDTFGVPVVEAYAMTEAAHQMTSNPLRGKRKPGSVGFGQGVGVAILDDAGKQVPHGTEGEVCVRGRNVTPGYINNAAANAACFTDDGWFRTGDQGFLDPDGYVFLTGRLKELINRGGEKISPLEVDTALLEHPAVAEAIAFGVPHDMYGQEVNAAVVLKSGQKVTEEELKAFCTKKLAAFKCPKKIYFGDTLPRTATGKIQRRHVATYFIERAKGPKAKL